MLNIEFWSPSWGRGAFSVQLPAFSAQRQPEKLPVYKPEHWQLPQLLIVPRCAGFAYRQICEGAPINIYFAHRNRIKETRRAGFLFNHSFYSSALWICRGHRGLPSSPPVSTRLQSYRAEGSAFPLLLILIVDFTLKFALELSAMRKRHVNFFFGGGNRAEDLNPGPHAVRAGIRG